MTRRPLAAALLLLRLAPAAAAAAELPPQADAADATPALATVTVMGHYANGVGSSDAASAGIVTARLIESRPALRTGELLEFVPGVIVTQHSGDGKANQYFLRGFNLDHGTDFASFVDGMPVNAPTHAHGQGYADLNFLIPELVQRIDYRKGPYDAEAGDFASAGSARMQLINTLPRGIAVNSAGERGYARALLADSTGTGPGQLLYAFETAHNNGPWVVPERAHHASGLLRYSWGHDAWHGSVTAMAYDAGWHATDQIPLRAVQAGLIGRYGAISPSDGGSTARTSLSLRTERQYDDGVFKLDAWAIRSRVDLFNDFTYFLDNPVQGDQFEQAEQRRTFGAAASRSLATTLGGREGTATFGAQLRQDRLDPVGLYAAVDGVRQAPTQVARVRETSVAAYADHAMPWTPWLRSLLGLRVDRFRFDVDSSIARNSGQASQALASPKATLVLGPWSRTEAFLNYGWGYHSNDARGVTSHLSAKELTPTDPAPGLVRSKGAELGLRSEIVPGLQSSLALWQLDLDSELVFSGDAGDTQPSGATHRQGVEFNNHCVASRWLLLDADVSLSQARFRIPQGDAPNIGTAVPGSVRQVLSLGATVTDLGPWSGHVGLRFFGPRPLIEDNSRQSRSSSLVYLRLGYRLAPSARLSLDVFNVFNRQVSDIDYWYTSRLPGEPAAGVNDVHFHPAEPRTLRLTLNLVL